MPAMTTENPWVAALRGFAQFGERVAVASRGRTLSYAELARQAKAVCAAILEAGAQPGEPVAIVARNGPGVVVASYGVMASGVAEFVVDLNLGPDDVAYAMRIMGVRAESFSGVAAMVISPPAAVWRSALPSRLCSIWRSRIASPRTQHGSRVSMRVENSSPLCSQRMR